MEAVVILIVIVVLGVLIGTGLALVRGRRESGVLEPPPAAPLASGSEASVSATRR